MLETIKENMRGRVIVSNDYEHGRNLNPNITMKLSKYLKPLLSPQAVRYKKVKDFDLSSKTLFQCGVLSVSEFKTAVE